MKKQTIENTIIIGGGPAGLAAALYTARANLNPLVFAGSPPGGQLYLTTEVENYPGQESILGPQLIERMRKQAEKFGARIIDENVNKVNFLGKSTQINTDKKTDYTEKLSVESVSLGKVSALSVIVATGAKAIWLGLESETRLRGKGVSACATCDGFFFRDKIVAVVGGGDTAMEEALTLTRFAKKVYIIHRRDTFRASKIMQERIINHPKVEIIWNTVVEEVMGTNRVEGVRLKMVDPRSSIVDEKKIQHSGSNIKDLSIDGLFVAIGHKPDTDIFSKQLELDQKGYIVTTEKFALELAKFKVQNSIYSTSSRQEFKMKTENEKINEILSKFNLNFQSGTSVPGVFAAGDCVDHIYRQAATAAGMGVGAALDAQRWLESVKIG